MAARKNVVRGKNYDKNIGPGSKKYSTGPGADHAKGGTGKATGKAKKAPARKNVLRGKTNKANAAFFNANRA